MRTALFFVTAQRVVIVTSLQIRSRSCSALNLIKKKLSLYVFDFDSKRRKLPNYNTVVSELFSNLKCKLNNKNAGILNIRLRDAFADSGWRVFIRGNKLGGGGCMKLVSVWMVTFVRFFYVL